MVSTSFTSLVEIITELTPQAFSRIGAARVGGRPLRIELDRGPKGGRSAAKATAHPGTQRKRDAREQRDPREHRREREQRERWTARDR